jgi:hypothetical protein
MRYRPNSGGDSMICIAANNVTWTGANKIRSSAENQTHRPDRSGEEGKTITKEIFRTLIRMRFNAFLNGFMSYSFNSYYEDKEWKPIPDAVMPFQEVLQKIINFDIPIEIIGSKIYCFNSKEVRK